MITTRYKDIFQLKLKRWLDRRIPASDEITLSQRSIFIVPSKVGWMFTLLLVLLLITAINYQNSLIYALVFWLFSIAISAMIFTYRNLASLTIKTGNAVKGYAGDSIEIPLRLLDDSRDHQGLNFSWNKEICQADVLQGIEKEIKVPYQLGKRGFLSTERIKLLSRYPFGLYTCWTWITLNTQGVVYPKPITIPFIAGLGDGDDIQTDANLVIGNDEFIGLRSYQAGDSLKHIAWKYLAKGKGLLTKEYDNQQLSMQWLDWHSLQGKPEEERLSILTGWVLMAEQEGRAYGLKLPNRTIQPSLGDAHRTLCLRQLALYNLSEQSQ
jgi:uncharacterized protein (DUF58 family)